MTVAVPSQLPPPRAILFDWDNTLVDTLPVIHAALTETFTRMGHQPWTFEETRQRTRYALREAFPKLFGDRWETARDIFYAAFERVHLEALTPFDESAALLAHLHGQGMFLGVISNKRGELLRAEAAHLGWDKYFGQVVGAGDAARDKPAPEPVYLALDPSGLEAGPAVWMVGDSAVDMEIAYAAGLTPVAVRHTPPPQNEFDNFPPSCSFGSCTALLAYFCSNIENF